MSGNSQRPWSAPQDVADLEELLSRPTDSVVQALQGLDGDVVFLGVGGKMGPTMARMARRAFDLAGVRHRVIGVSRFRDPAVRQRLEEAGVLTHVADLLDEHDVRELPAAAAVVSMSGFKFGTRDTPALTWATNCCVPALICRRYHDTRIVAFSTGNVYGLVPRASGGSRESDPPRPDGEYAMSALGRERIYAYFSQPQQTPLVILRLNYATELRYGVLVDLAQQVHLGQPVDVTMGYVNVIWLGDANAMTLVALRHAASPARIVNLAGPEIALDCATSAYAWRSGWIGRSNCAAARASRPCSTTASTDTSCWDVPRSRPQMLEWTADWVAGGGATLGKPTHFQVRSGQF